MTLYGDSWRFSIVNHFADDGVPVAETLTQIMPGKLGAQYDGLGMLQSEIISLEKHMGHACIPQQTHQCFVTPCAQHAVDHRVLWANRDPPQETIGITGVIGTLRAMGMI